MTRPFGITLNPGSMNGDIAPPLIAELRHAALEHGFVVLRDQRLTDDALLGLGRHFGVIEERVIKYSSVGPSKSRQPTLWHHHNCCDGALDDWILYYTPAIPDDGGGIEFFDAASWFNALDDDTRAWALQRRMRHDYKPVVHAGIPPVANPEWHPMVMTREAGDTQQQALYAAAHAMEIDDDSDIREPLPDSPWHRAKEAAKLATLYHLHQPQAHDLILWDMKMVAHRGYPWNTPTLRVIHEVIIRQLTP